MSSPEVVQMCCLIDEGERCRSRATSATFNKKLLKTALQRRQRLYADLEVEKRTCLCTTLFILWCERCALNRITFTFPLPQAGHSYVCEQHRILLHSMRAKRKRKDSEEEGDYQPEVSSVSCCQNSIIAIATGVVVIKPNLPPSPPPPIGPGNQFWSEKFDPPKPVFSWKLVRHHKLGVLTELSVVALFNNTCMAKCDLDHYHLLCMQPGLLLLGPISNCLLNRLQVCLPLVVVLVFLGKVALVFLGKVAHTI